MIIKNSFIRRSNALQMLPNDIIENELVKRATIFSGDEISFPLYLFQKIFTDLHYGKTISVDNIFLFEMLIGYVTYGTDRLIDAYTYQKNPELELSSEKKEMYDNILKNENIVMPTLLASYLICFKWLLQKTSTLPFSLLLFFNSFYKQIKTKIGPIKPIFIGVMWVLASVIIPSIIYSDNYDILNDPGCYLPPVLTIMASSNMADIKDINEDKEQGVNTIPVLFGIEASLIFTIVTSMLSSEILYTHPNFHNNIIQNVLFELNNLGVIVSTLIQYKKIVSNDEI